jgi:ABC-2 type transport system ATP-binding protein
MIEAMGLTKYYGPRAAIQNVTFSVAPGQIAGFLGVNGAGKTTTMRILACYLYPTEGTARVAGYDILNHPLEVRRATGYMPEHPLLYNEMTVRSFLRFVAGLRGVPRRQVAERIDTVIEQCGLQAVADRIIGRLSRGTASGSGSPRPSSMTRPS